MGPICNGCWVWSSWSVAAHFTHDVVNTRNSHLWDRDNPHGTVESNYQHRSSVNVWCGVTGDQLIGPYIFPKRLTGDIYANFLQDELPALLANVPLQTRRQMYYQRDGAQPHFSQVVRQYLNHKFPNWWIGRGGNTIGQQRHSVWTHKINMCGVTWTLWCMHTKWTELLQRILNVARSINNAALLRKVTSYLIIRVKKFIQVDEGHFEQLAWVLNGESVTVHLTAYLNKCTMFLFPF